MSDGRTKLTPRSLLLDQQAHTGAAKTDNWFQNIPNTYLDQFGTVFMGFFIHFTILGKIKKSSVCRLYVIYFKFGC